MGNGIIKILLIGMCFLFHDLAFANTIENRREIIERLKREGNLHTMENMMDFIDSFLSRGMDVVQGRYDYFSLMNHRELLGELHLEKNEDCIVQYTSDWLGKYSSQFPEVGLLHLLGGGGIEDVKHVYDYSTDVSFRRYCTLAFCLNDVRIAPEQSPGLPYVSSEISAQLDVMEDGDSISLVLTLINNSKSEKGWIYSSKSLSSNIEICREDGVPVYYPRQMLFILPEQKSIPSLERSTYEPFDVTVLQPNSVITRSEVLKLNKKSVSKIWSIREAYLHDRGPYYTLFDNIISRHIKHPLKLRIRYVYDSSLLDSFLLENGHINYPPDTALPHFRIESNPVELLINENGKLVSRIGVSLK